MSRLDFGAAQLNAVISAYLAGLERHSETINALNVFPVPDGDTGTNMLATLAAVRAEIGLLGACPEMAPLCQAIAKGSLMGARGNSGVILCQILRALCAELAGEVLVSPAKLARGLEQAASAARASVQRPVEGTILTVAKEAALGAAAGLALGGLADVAEAARDRAVVALHETPSQLLLLAQAGVVDAGGAGLVLLYEAFCAVIGEREMPAELRLPEAVAELLRGVRRPSRSLASLQGSPLALLSYEVMFFLATSDEQIGDFRRRWSEIGDSIVVVGGEGIWNCHIHTDDIGAAIEAGIEAGRPHNIRVTDLREETSEEAWVLSGQDPTAEGPEPSPEESALTCVVVVSSGEGIARIFSSLGAAKVILGGQSMNPSTQELLEAVEGLSAKDVVILPNNSNIVPVARQVEALSDKNVYVVETPGVQEGFAALLDFDPEASGEDNAARMTQAAARVVAGEVTQAVRAAPSPVGSVKRGDWIGLSRAGIEAVEASLAEATCALLEAMVQEGHEIVTLIEGAGCPRPEIERVLAYLAERHPRLNVERLQGGQLLYPLLVSIE